MKMRILCCIAALVCVTLFGCAQPTHQDTKAEPSVQEKVKGADVFNPWRNEKLPSSRHLSKDGDAILGAMGGRAQSIQAEAKHRPYWREEIYPVVFGSPMAAHEILVVLDFANPKSEKMWAEVLAAIKGISEKDTKVVVCGKSSELYGTDLLGLMIWISHQRKGQCLDYLSYALGRWNAVKAAQKSAGHVKVFSNEYDATAKSTDLPIHYTYISRLKPPVAERDELALSRYSYDAGNVNSYQTMQILEYYDAKAPCVIVDGRVLRDASASQIRKSLQQ